MMRNVNYVLLGAVLGAASFGVAQKADILGRPATAAISDTYRSLNLFGDVFEKVRTDYVEKPQDQKLVESAITGMIQKIGPPQPPPGSQPSHSVKTSTRIGAMTKFGSTCAPIDRPTAQ